VRTAARTSLIINWSIHWHALSPNYLRNVTRVLEYTRTGCYADSPHQPIFRTAPAQVSGRGEMPALSVHVPTEQETPQRALLRLVQAAGSKDDGCTKRAATCAMLLITVIVGERQRLSADLTGDSRPEETLGPPVGDLRRQGGPLIRVREGTAR